MKLNEKQQQFYLSQINLRMKTDAILINAARDLRTKADNVGQALNHRIMVVDEARIRIESELTEVRCRQSHEKH